MIKRKHIPISDVKTRYDKAYGEFTDRPISCTYEQVLKSIENENIDESFIVKDYIRDSTNAGISDTRWESCLAILEKTNNKKYYKNIFSSVKDEIITSCNPGNMDTIFNRVGELDIPKEDREALMDKIDSCKKSDRIINNKKMIEKRYNLDKYYTDLSSLCDKPYVNITDVCESFASLIDTYQMPLRKKVAIALEMGIYINESVGNKDNADLVQGIFEYFIKSYPIISDRDYKSIMNTLESNEFIKESDLVGINYMFNYPSKSFSEKILEASSNKELNKEYKELIIKISNCKTAAVAKGLIKAAFALIFSTFIIAATVAWSSVVVLLCAVFSLILIVGLSPAVLIGSIKKELKKSEDNLKSLKSDGSTAREQMKRNNKVYRFTSDLCNSVQDNPMQEASNLINSIIPDSGLDAPLLKDQLDDGIQFDLMNYAKVVSESEKFADSDDVKDLIKKYKADQDKSMPKLKRLVTKIFTKKPEHIIDDIPDVLNLIRNFCILSTVTVPVVGPGIALVGFCVNHFVSMSLKREEAERVLKYFKKERDKMEKKLDKMKDGDKRDDLDAYIKCLDKSIDKLEEYRDSLYTSKELDAKYELDEAAVNFVNKITIDEFMSTYFYDLCKATKRAIQLIRNEVIRSDDQKYIYEEYECEGTTISNSINGLTKTELISFFTTPSGIIDIPLGKICDHNNANPYLRTIEICEKVNEFIDSKFIVTSFKLDGKAIITLNCTKAIAVDYLPEMDHTMTESALDIIANFKFNCDIADKILECDLDSIQSGLISNVDLLSKENPELLAGIINTSNINADSFVNSLKDYKYCLENPEDMIPIDSLILKINSKDISDNDRIDGDPSLLNSIYQLESIQLLEQIIQEAKDQKKNPSNKDKKEKGKLIDKAKSKIDDIKKKNEDKEKVPLSTTVKLGAANAANKVKDLSTKEQEVSKTVDAYSANIVKSCKQALVSNRREAIIKGSVIPSFSKLIKAAIGITVIGVVTTPAIAAIVAVGALGVSKYLTVKEKQLLLDEIDVELEVIDKQLNNVEDDPKRHKELLMYKRKLQRESQRIRYNLKIKAKDAPNPNA